ncbi:hypothetical protein WBG78_28540 [Chryseolinea sp. T2]|uniref:hypothetical protein n=1 Tax=Chryseolinea sp. T2 TaxID=3129255 RepID=UPI003076C683
MTPHYSFNPGEFDNYDIFYSWDEVVYLLRLPLKELIREIEQDHERRMKVLHPDHKKYLQ